MSKERTEAMIRCAYHELRAPAKLKVHPSNLNTHPEEQVLACMQVLRTAGFRRPITISKRSGYIVRGHVRRIASMRLGFVRVPVDLQEYESEEQELRDLVADATIRNGSELSGHAVREVLESISKEKIELTGMNSMTVQAILSDFPEKKAQAKGKKSVTLKVQEIRAADKDAVLAIIQEVVGELGYTANVY